MKRFALAVVLAAALAAPAAAQVPSGETTEVGASRSEAPAGDEITVHGSGWEPGAQVTLRIAGQPLAATTVGADGRFARPVMIPNDLGPGSYEVTAEGPDATGNATSLTFQVEVVEGATPRGSFVIVGIVAAITLLVFVVTLIWFFGKRRRTSLAEAAEAGETPAANPDPRDAPQPADRD